MIQTKVFSCLLVSAQSFHLRVFQAPPVLDLLYNQEHEQRYHHYT